MGNRRSSAALLAACLSTTSTLTASASAQSLLQTLTGSAPTQRFGASVAFVGDVNGDGVSDIAVGAPWPELTGTGYGIKYTQVGFAELRSGADGALLQHKDGLWTGDQFGARVSAAGDLDGDSVPDWIVASLDSEGYQTDLMFPGTFVQGGGHARAFSGATGALLHQMQGGVSKAELWFSVDRVGDVNGDGRDDFVVGHTDSLAAFDWSTLQFLYTPVGAASLRSGLTGTALWSRQGTVLGEDLGYCVSGVGDVDGDGAPDFLVSSRGPEIVELYSGLTFAVLRTHLSPAPGSDFGAFVNDLGDLDADGTGDYVVGAPAGGGLLHVYSGATGSPLTPLTGPIAGANVGMSAAAIGDVDLDGLVDLAVRGLLTNPQYFNLPYEEALVLSGASYEVRAMLAGSLTATGHAVALAGGVDVNLDGRPELLVGSFDNTYQAGQVEVFSTVPAGLSFHGSGTPGCLGPERLTGDSVPSIGNSGFELRGDRAPASTISLVLVSDALDGGSDPLGIGVVVLVNILQAGELLAFDGASSTTGFTSAPAPIPLVPALVGKTYHAQEFRLWPSSQCTPSVFGLSSTAGLTLTIQP